MIAVAVYNMKGGVGKSTAAVNIAYLAAASGARTLLWDLDAQAAASFAFRVRPKVQGFGKESLRQFDTLIKAIKATDYENLDLLPADFAYRNLDRFLHRLGKRDRNLSKLLDKVGSGYSHLFMDCPPGLSTLSESVFNGANLVLVPTIPTVLSLRTLARFIEHFRRRGDQTKVVAFLNMVDRRKLLHRQVSAWALQRPEFFLTAQIPYASVVEQMSVQRMPLALIDRQGVATASFNTLWSNIRDRLSKPTEGPDMEKQSSAFVKAISDLIARLGDEADEPNNNELPLNAPSVFMARTTESAVVTHRIKMDNEEVFDALARDLGSAELPSETHSLAHIFDTDGHALQREGYLLQLWEESERFAVVLEHSIAAGETAKQHEERHIAAIDGRWAADVLAEALSPLAVLERRLKRPLPHALSAAITITGKQTLRRVGWSKRQRRRLGPASVTFGEQVVKLHFDFEQICCSNSEVEYQIQVTSSRSDPRISEEALSEILSRVGMSWPSATCPTPASQARLTGEAMEPPEAGVHEGVGLPLRN